MASQTATNKSTKQSPNQAGNSHAQEAPATGELEAFSEFIGELRGVDSEQKLNDLLTSEKGQKGCKAGRKLMRNGLPFYERTCQAASESRIVDGMKMGKDAVLLGVAGAAVWKAGTWIKDWFSEG